jgi:hypothetical protein
MSDAKLTRQMEADILLRHYQARRQKPGWPLRPFEDRAIIHELQELQDRINQLMEKWHAGR